MKEYLVKVHDDGSIYVIIESISNEDYLEKLDIIRPLIAKDINVMYANNPTRSVE